MARRPIVYIANKGMHDYRPAHKWGDVVFLTQGLLHKFDIGSLYRQIEDKLKDSQPDDFFVPTGLPILCGLGSAILAHKHGQVNYLLYQRDGYVVRTVRLDD